MTAAGGIAHVIGRQVDAEVVAERERCAAVVRAKADHIRRAVPASDVAAEAFKFAVTMLDQALAEIESVTNPARGGQ